MKVVLFLLATAAAMAAPTRMVLKDGTVYLLQDPPRLSGSRLVFTTAEGKTFSIDESEVESIGTAPAPTAAPRRLNPHDSHALGAFARQQRARKGKASLIAPRSGQGVRPTPRRTPRKPG
jgi:hypothetical protein